MATRRTRASAGEPLDVWIAGSDGSATGGLTDAELRASPIEVDVVSSVPLTVDPTGLATEAKQDSVLTALGILGAELAQKTEPANQQHVIVDSGALPTGASTLAEQQAQSTLIGAVTETAPASDTASSGLNGRLQRIAQRITSLITALGTPFQAGGSIGNTGFAVTAQIGAANSVEGQVSVDTTATGVEVAAARATRRSITVVNHGTTAVYLKSGSVTSSNGILLAGVIGAAITFYHVKQVKGIVASGSQTVSYQEEYD